MLRVLVDDQNTIRFTDAVMDARLNSDAKWVGRLIAKHQGNINYENAVGGTITGDGTTTVFTVLSANSPFLSEFLTQALDTDGVSVIPMRRVDPEDGPQWQGTDGLDDHGNIVYWLQTLAGAVRMHFPVALRSGVNVVFNYSSGVTDIATGGANDSSVFTLLPPAYHDLVVARSAWILLGSDGADTNPAFMQYRDLRDDAIATLEKRNEPTEIRNVMGW